MTSEEIKNEIDTTIGKANVRLLEIMGDKPFSGVVISATYAGNISTIRSGDAEIAKVSLDEKGLKKAKSAIWPIVYKAKGKPAKNEKPAVERNGERHRVSSLEDFKGEINSLLEFANNKLKGIVGGGFPFTMEEVELSYVIDGTGVYVHSGKTPIIAELCGWDVSKIYADIRSAVFEVVDATRTAVERRKWLKAEADELASESAKLDAAKAALTAAGLDLSSLGLAEDAMAKAIVATARSAAHVANRGLYLNYDGACEAIGGRAAARLVVRGFAGGIVVSSGGKPCLVTRFPKKANNRTLEGMLAFIKADVETLGESRRKYLARVQKMVDREKAVRSASERYTQALEICAEA